MLETKGSFAPQTTKYKSRSICKWAFKLEYFRKNRIKCDPWMQYKHSSLYFLSWKTCVFFITAAELRWVERQSMVVRDMQGPKAIVKSASRNSRPCVGRGDSESIFPVGPCWVHKWHFWGRGQILRSAHGVHVIQQSLLDIWFTGSHSPTNTQLSGENYINGDNQVIL